VRWVAMIRLESLSHDERMRVLNEFLGQPRAELVSGGLPFWFFPEAGAAICTQLFGGPRSGCADLRAVLPAFDVLKRQLALDELPVELAYVREPRRTTDGQISEENPGDDDDEGHWARQEDR
jgi:hypothetical protein